MKNKNAVTTAFLYLVTGVVTHEEVYRFSKICCQEITNGARRDVLVDDLFEYMFNIYI